jgi:CHAT domain-containing protein
MAVRSAAGDRSLALLVRERQDLLGLWQKRNGLLTWARSQPPEKRNAHVDQRIQDDIALIDKRLAEIDEELRKSFPQFASLSSPEGLTIAEVQAWLQRDEALLLVLDTRELEPYLDTPAAKPMPETFLWVVTKTEMRWARIALGTRALGAHVAALRCGLDHTLWQAPASARSCEMALSTRPRTEAITTAGVSRKVQVLPFDLARAHELYAGLLGPVEDLIKDKQLLVVPSGPLTSLPLNVLITQAPDGDGVLADYRRAAWLGARQATTVLPSVASLKALREIAKTSHAIKPYFGVGNPLLDGPQDDPTWADHYKREAQAARERQRCATANPLRLASTSGRPPPAFSTLFRGRQADIEHVRHLAPLPETADELCEVGRRLGAPETEILLGDRASEGALKELSEQGRLADYAILHFATHGALTGQVLGAAEPGLILTPPAAGTSDPRALERDDGYLSASEIAGLKLDADWVILSACNTAGPSTGSRDESGENAEALSGLARAFFYAGARTLLVSHWEVGSHAAVKLTTGAFAALKAKPSIGRAEALRLSMRELIENGEGLEVHPAQWAPFVVVGEGGARLQTASLPAPSTASEPLKAESPPKEEPAAAPARPKPKAQTKKTKSPDWKSDLWRQ